MAEGTNIDWPSSEFRQKIRDQLEAYTKQHSITLPLNPPDLERTVFEKTTSKADYMSRLHNYLMAATKQQKQQQQQQQSTSNENSNNMVPTNSATQQTVNNNNNATNVANNTNQNNNNTNTNINASQHQILLRQQLLQQQQQQQQLLQQQQQQQLDPMNALQHLTKQSLPQGQQGNQLLRPTTAGGITPRLPQYTVNRPSSQQIRGEILATNPRMVSSQFVSGLSPQQFHVQPRSRQMQNMHAFNQMSGSPSSVLLQQQQQQQQANLSNSQPLTPQQSQMQQQLQQPSPAMPTPLGHQSMLTPSPSNHPTQSPATTLSHLSPSLNTPANEDAEYLQKWEQLQRFIEPLKRTIQSLDKEGDRKLDLNKMKNLLDILSDKHKRLSLNTLLKCESVLERQLQMPSSVQQTSAPPPAKTPSEGVVGEELLGLIEAHLDHPCLTHTLQRTFRNTTHPYFLHQREKEDCREWKPAVIKKETHENGVKEMEGREGGVVGRLMEEVQRETSQLEFSICVSDQQLPGDHLLLICNLDRASLPQVPSLMVSLPIEYPSKTPTPLFNNPLYECSDLFRRIKENLSFDLKRLQDNFTLTTLLNTWESAVVKSCAVA